MSVISAVDSKFKKPHVVDVRSGDSVRVHQKIREGSKERIQIFEGLVIRTRRANSHTANITVRRVASGIGVEKTYLLHSPLITKVEVVKRSKVRRNYLSYMRDRTGKAARMTGLDFDREAVNFVPEEAVVSSKQQVASEENETTGAESENPKAENKESAKDQEPANTEKPEESAKSTEDEALAEKKEK